MAAIWWAIASAWAQSFASAAHPTNLDGGPGSWVSTPVQASRQLTLLAWDAPTDEMIMQVNDMVRPNDYWIMAPGPDGKLAKVGELKPRTGERWVIDCDEKRCSGRRIPVLKDEPLAMRLPALEELEPATCTVLADVDAAGHVRDGRAYGCPAVYANALKGSVRHWLFTQGSPGTRRAKVVVGGY